MGLLFTYSEDDRAEGLICEFGMHSHDAIISKSRELKGYPLVRRLSDYYADITFEPDEIEDLIKELNTLRKDMRNDILKPLIEICEAALNDKTGIQTISD